MSFQARTVRHNENNISENSLAGMIRDQKNNKDADEIV